MLLLFSIKKKKNLYKERKEKVSLCSRVKLIVKATEIIYGDFILKEGKI
jgi:hypothetical protein